MANNPTRKQAQTSYGQIEYDTLRCSECTNQTVTSELTHLYYVRKQGLNYAVGAEDIIVYRVCVGCVREFYGYEGEILRHDQLVECYADTDVDNQRYGFQPIGEMSREKTEYPTQHGNVEMEIADCALCEGEWVVDELGTVHIPWGRADGCLQTEVMAYCPNCREMYLSAPDHGAGSVLSDMMGEASREGIDGIGRQEDDGEPPIPGKFYAKTLLIVFAGGVFFSVIFASTTPVVGGLIFVVALTVMMTILVDCIGPQMLYKEEYGL